MATIKQSLPASLRADSLNVREPRGVVATDRRPYLVTPAARKPVTQARKQLALFPHESEDARLTGATRSLYRRLLALNLPRPDARMEVSSQMAHEISGSRSALAGARIA
ncbi:MAG: hypothetical protein M3Y50_09335 [Acidobacteriota bacterium]|nr:hypothetical protein [Acidobacteriota bacterium]